MLLLEDRRYYVYVYISSARLYKNLVFAKTLYHGTKYFFGGEIIYVGKGKGRRCLSHIKKFNKDYTIPNKLFQKELQALKDFDIDPKIQIVENHLTNKEAYFLERCLIKELGRRIKNEGYLTNISEGDIPSSREDVFNNWVALYGEEEAKRKTKAWHEDANKARIGQVSPLKGKTYEEIIKDPVIINFIKKKKSVTMSKTMSGRTPWNKGLTKETDDRVKKYGINGSKTKELKRSKNFMRCE